ncbi:hypothetical protein [Rhizobium leguminosarum]|uniref:Uncharacterized protein n=1 Tax=Rhizobium leguminosarum TaxID=384 RepID=A0A7K3VRW4_RHILE|nr:hypothetical protein [Rhizobium leguminosarum]NEK19936.1 hypothetical protein [Rhizobium leguminosarum]
MISEKKPSSSKESFLFSFVTVTDRFVIFAEGALLMPVKHRDKPMRKTVNITTMDEPQRREYDRQRQAEYRQRKREAVEKGAAAPNEALTRELLADIAIAMIATSAPGSEAITAAVNRYYQGTGWPMQIIRKVKTGKLKPKVLRRV